MEPAADAPPPAGGPLRRVLPWVVVLLATGATLGAGFWLKEQCVEHKWDGPQGWYCYSDMGILYGERGFDKDHVPYLQEFNEYPPVVAAIQYGAAMASDKHEDWIHWNEAVLALCAMGTSAALVAMTRPSWRPLAFALAPPLALYAFHNWDLAALFLTTLALWMFERGRPGWCGALLALGFYAKVYPALFLPLLGMALLREEGGLGRRGWRFGLSSVGTLAGVAAPFLVLSPSRFLETFLFHARRGPTMESMWNALHAFADGGGADGLASFLAGPGLRIASLALIVAALAFFCWAVRTDRLHWMHACLGILLCFLLLNPVMSMQYALWVLPFLALLRIPLWLVLGFFAADGWIYYTVLGYFGHTDQAHFDAMAWASLLRACTHVLLLAWVLFRIRSPPSVATPSTVPPATPLPVPSARPATTPPGPRRHAPAPAASAPLDST